MQAEESNRKGIMMSTREAEVASHTVPLTKGDREWNGLEILGSEKVYKRG